MAAAAGHPVPPARLDRIRADTTEPAAPRATLLYRDLTAGYPVEGEQIIGDLVECAHRLGVAVPLLELVRPNLRVHQARVG
nr:ketopantoate reductase C-terminal domain-containing protein [Amycolatopsis sulphurea]